MDVPYILGFIGTIIVAAAYIPQIYHIVKKHCSMGLSVAAWSLWLFATILIFIHALTTVDWIFIVLVAIHLVAITVILFLSLYYKNSVCDICLYKASESFKGDYRGYKKEIRNS